MSLAATRLQNWRMSTPEMDRNMVRRRSYGAFDFFAEQTNSPMCIVDEETRRRIFQSIGNTVQIPVLDYNGTVQVDNAFSCNIPDNANGSKLVTINFATLSTGFSMVPGYYNNNEIGYERDFNRKMENISRELAHQFDVLAVAALDAGKTQVGESLNYSLTGGVMQVPPQMASEALGDISTIMRANSYNRQIHIVGNAGVDSLVSKLAEKGLYNDTNKQLEYQDKIFHFSNNIVDEQGISGTLYAVEDGNVAMLTRVDTESLAGRTNGEETWGVVRMPYLDLEVGMHYKKETSDQYNIDGDGSQEHLGCVVKEYFGFAIEVAFITSYNTDMTAIPNPIVKAEIEARGANTPFATPVYITNTNTMPVLVSNDAENPVLTQEVQ